MAEAAWDLGDPGLLFLDEINRHNPCRELGRIETTNPCGEQPLLAHESCTLGSLNLAAFCNGADVDWQTLKDAIRDAVVFLDNVVEANCYPLPEIEAATRRTRKIGLGVMGFADLLARLDIPYDSEAGLELGATIARFLAEEARSVSRELGKKRGSYPAFRSNGELPLRNASVTCIAPTGTISLIAGVSSGIEPFFALAFARHMLDGQRIIEINPSLQAELKRLKTNGEDRLDAVRKTGSLRQIKDLPEGLRRRFPIALEIAPQWHVRMQAAFQAHIDAAVSKTVNLPHDAPVNAVREVFNLARALHLKGITVYRYGSRSDQTLSLIEEEARPDCRECAV
jgi:ribonucleoside-diphosphate reductase alpha chain